MARAKWIIAAGVLAAALAGAVVYGLREDPQETARAAVAGEDTLQAFHIDRPRNPVRAEDFAAYPVREAHPHLHDYAGRYVLLNFWATWCEPCKVEMPALNALYGELRGKNFVVLAVSMEEEADKVRKFIETTSYAFPVLADPEGQVAELYGVHSIPLTYLIDTQGQIVGRALGPREWNDPRLRAYFAAQSAPR